MTFLVSRTNDGYAQGNNKGLSLAFSDDEIEYIMILNNDILFVDDIIPALILQQQEITNCAIISPILYKKDLESIDYNCARRNHTEWEVILTNLFWYKNIFGCQSKFQKRRYLLKYNPSLMKQPFIEIELPSGSCMLAKKKMMQEIGSFDPNTFLYFEENILYKKILKTGKRNYLVPSLICVHLGASSTKKSKNSFVMTRGLNSAVYYLKEYCNLNILQKILLPFAIFSFLIRIKLIKIFQEK
ncbi:MAG: glycosyltransferase family 2 protein [Prevotellaceae bacterium]|nr:glycosyltransferase family 2 protein [Prevotellaceae bacterium]